MTIHGAVLLEDLCLAVARYVEVPLRLPDTRSQIHVTISAYNMPALVIADVACLQAGYLLSASPTGWQLVPLLEPPSVAVMDECLEELRSPDLSTSRRLSLYIALTFLTGMEKGRWAALSGDVEELAERELRAPSSR